MYYEFVVAGCVVVLYLLFLLKKLLLMKILHFKPRPSCCTRGTFIEEREELSLGDHLLPANHTRVIPVSADLLQKLLCFSWNFESRNKNDVKFSESSELSYTIWQANYKFERL